ncbi:MAG: DUF4270 family protein [Bernardetiaceae bacterium]|nr:DUF4270 family protein [Bernardetiaceae bacterium]
MLNSTFTDTVSLRTSVVLLDSVNTTKQLLVGSVADAQFGNLRATTYTKVTLPRDTLKIDSIPNPNLVFDSAVVIMNVNYRYGDTTVAQNFQVHQLLQTPDSARSYYGFEELPTGELLGQASFRASGDNRQLRVRLSQAFGNRFFERANRGRDFVLFQAGMDAFLPGLRISAVGPANATVLGFQNFDAALAIYYRRASTDTVRRVRGYRLLDPFQASQQSPWQFTPQSWGQSFVRFAPDLSRSRFLANLPRQRTLSTVQTSNQSYVQEGLGLATWVQFPHIQTLARLGRRVVINRAVLVINPTASNFDAPDRANQGVPTTLVMSLADANGRPVRNSNGTERFLQLEYQRVAAGATPPRAEAVYITGGRTYPDLDITSYLQAVLDGRTPNNGFLLRSGTQGSGVNKLLFGDSRATNPAERLVLRLNYTVVND